MFRFTTLIAATLTAIFVGTGPAQAQVFVRAPFVRVEVGGPGVYVRAPFVSLWLPGQQPVYQATAPYGGTSIPMNSGYFPPAPPVSPATAPPKSYDLAPTLTPFGPAGTRVPAPPAPGSSDTKEPTLPLPFPQVVPDATGAPPAPPQPVQTRYPTLQEFSKSFQAKAGNYDVTILNPVTNQPTRVRFTLPEGSPRRVIVNADEIEFRYTLRQWVRIGFDKDGAIVTAR